MKFPKPKKVSLTKLKKKAWAIFSQYIRYKYADKNGMEQCYTCSTVKSWKEMQCGHGIGGRNNAILFDERLVRPQCVGCNMFANGRYYVFTSKLIDELGKDAYCEMAHQAKMIVQYKASDYQAIYEKYKHLMENL